MSRSISTPSSGGSRKASSASVRASGVRRSASCQSWATTSGARCSSGRCASGSQSTSSSIVSTPASTAARKLSSVLPGAIRSAPLWPTRRSSRLAARAQKSWFSPAKISETESSVKMRRIESAKVLAVERTLMLSGAPGRSGSVSVTTICSMPELS